MKKKVFAISLAVALIAIVMVSGTLAWFSDTDEATNTFTIGSIEIVQHEHQRDAQGNIEAFQQNQFLLPIVNTADPASDANYVEKMVAVENVGENEAYICVNVAIPTALVDIVNRDLDTTGWTELTRTNNTTTVGGVDYTVYSYVRTDALAVGGVTNYLLKGVWMDAEVDLQPNPADNNAEQFCTWNDTTDSWDFCDYDTTGTLDILVATQACQASGFANANAAITTVFPNIPDFTSVSP